MNVNADGIPAELKPLKQWVAWQLEVRDGKPTKVPMVPGCSRRASVTMPETWTDFETARTRVNGHANTGVGFVLVKDIVGTDFDKVRATPKQEFPVWVPRIVSRLGSYAEVSPSGTGLHIFTRGSLPSGARRSGCCEMYDTARFFCITGQRLESAPATIEPADIAWLHRLMAAGVFDFAKRPKLQQLLNGDIGDYGGDDSAADLGFCSILAALGLSEPDIDSAYRLSGLARSKWDERRGDSTYGQQTIRKALPTTQVEPSNWRTGLMVTVLASGKTRVEANHANAIHALGQAPEWAGVIAYDAFADRIVSRRSPPWGGESGIWRDVDDVFALEWLQRAGIGVRSSKTVYESVQAVAYGNVFNSLQDHLNGIVYDGQCRLERWLITYLGAEDTPYVRAIGPRILIAAVARAFEPGCKSDCMAVLESGQGELKSTTCSTLAINHEWFTDHITGDLGSKSSREDIRGKWLVEQSEMDKIKGKELEPIKNFLSTQIDNYRESYGRRSGPHPRTCLFIGTTNARFYLADPTGARRFWPVRCGHIDLDALKRDVTQLRGEAVSLYRQHHPWHLETPELKALAEAETEKRYVLGVWDTIIEHYIRRFDDWGNLITECRKRPTKDWEAELPWFGSTPDKVNTEDVLIHGIGKDPAGFTPRDTNEVAKYFNHLHWERKQEGTQPYRSKWYYNRPPASPPPTTPPPGRKL